jgi:TatD DNase family protein
MLIDSHCHLDCLQLDNYAGDINGPLKAARTQGVGLFLCVCIDLEHFANVLAIAEQNDDVYATVGCHPNTTQGQDPSAAELIALAQHEKVIAIGETGLDYFRTDAETDWQQQRFRAHIEAACATQLPLIIHTRNAFDDTMRILEETQASRAGGVMHCFSGSLAMAQQAIEMGFYISFSGIVTFKNALELKQVAQQIPLERMLIETDSPYLAPVPYRGKPNEPAYVKFVAEAIAQLRGISVDEVARITSENFKRLFKLDD